MNSMKHMSESVRWSVLGLAVAAALSVGACNTMEGAGQDVEATGDAVEDTARDTKRNM